MKDVAVDTPQDDLNHGREEATSKRNKSNKAEGNNRIKMLPSLFCGSRCLPTQFSQQIVAIRSIFERNMSCYLLSATVSRLL